MDHQFSTFTRKRDKKILQWNRNLVDYNGEKKGKPYTFLRDVSFSDCQLPCISDMQPQLRKQFILNVIDEDMKSDLEDSRAVNWYAQAIKLLPVCVSRDGSCLLHAASVAVWSVEDSLNTLRDLMLMTVKCNNNFWKRWKCQLEKDLQLLDMSQPEVIDQEWDDVIRSISDLGSSALSVAVPHRFLEGIHIYILSNILRRPIIIVTSGTARSVAGHDLQENHIGGLYLPLEWEPLECCKTPIVLGYSLSHFCPLISEIQPQHLLSLHRKKESLMFPLVSSDLGFLLVRFLKKEEDSIAWDLVQSYLLVKEVDIIVNGAVTKIPFAQMPLKPLEPEQNSLFEHYSILKERFTEVKFLKDQAQTTQEAAQQSRHPFYDIEMNSQTEVVAVRTPKGKSTLLRDPQNSRQTDLMHNLEQNENTPKQCIAESCTRQGRDHLQHFCHDCFRILTTAESAAKSTSQTKGHVADPATSKAKNLSTQTSEISLIPTAPLMSIEPQSYNPQLLSMMTDRCINNCGYRCSRQTYPYCHECYQVESLRAKNLEELSKSALNSQQNSVTVKAENGGRGTKEKSDPECFVVNRTLINSSSSEKSSLLEGEGHDILSHLLNISESLPKNELEIAGQQNCKSSEQNSNHKNSNIEPLMQCAHGNSDTSHGEAIANPIEKAAETKTTNSEGFAETDEKNLTGDIEVSEEPSCKVKCASPYCEIFLFPPDKLCSKCKDILKRGYEQRLQLSVSRAVENQLEKETKLLEKTAKPSLDSHPQDSLSSVRKTESQLIKHKVHSEGQMEVPHNLAKSASAVISHRPRGSKGKPCIVPDCPNYGDPRMNNMCSSCYFKSNPSAKPRRAFEVSKTKEKSSSSQIKAATEILFSKDKIHEHFFSQQETRNTIPAMGKFASSTQNDPVKIYHTSSKANHPSQKYTTHHQPSFQSFELGSSSFLSEQEPKSIVVTSKTGHSIYDSLHYLPPDSSYSFNQKADKDFEKAFEGILKSSARKCLSVHCQNYGNKEKEGYCNACYNVIRRQRVIELEAQRGVDVPDSGVSVDEKN